MTVRFGNMQRFCQIWHTNSGVRCVWFGDSDVSNGGTITIESPGLLTEIPASATAISVYGGSAYAAFSNSTPVWSGTKHGYYGTGASANHRYIGSMVKSGSSYTNKVIYNTGREKTTMDFQTLWETQEDKVFTAGGTYDVVLTYDWDVEAIINLTFSAVQPGNDIEWSGKVPVFISDVDITTDTVTVTLQSEETDSSYYVSFTLLCTASKLRV